MRRSRLRSEPRRGGEISTRRQPISKASIEQREKVAGQARCVACPNVAPFATIDPAHLTARAHGGCNDALCVVGLCRACHRAFDHRQLDLSVHVSGPAFVDELQHMLGHYNGDWVAMGERLTSGKVQVVDVPEQTGEAG